MIYVFNTNEFNRMKHETPVNDIFHKITINSYFNFAINYNSYVLNAKKVKCNVVNDISLMQCRFKYIT